MEVKQAIFLDKDGTIIPDVPYNVNPDFIELAPGVGDGLSKLKDRFSFYVISNQSGIAKGLFEFDALRNVEQKISELLMPYGVEISEFYYCPHDLINGEIYCNCKKPKPGLIFRAAAANKINLSNSYFIGDILNDVEAGRAAGCKAILIDNGNETEWKINGSRNRVPNFIATHFMLAVNYILRQEEIREFEAISRITAKNKMNAELERM